MVRLQAAQAAAEADADGQRADKEAAFDQQQAAVRRDRRQLRDVIDAEQLRTTDDPSEILRLAREAELVSSQLGHEAAHIAEQRLRRIAQDENRRHVLNGKGFAALCELTSRPRSIGLTRADMADRAEQKQRSARALITQVAAVAKLDDLLAHSASKAVRPCRRLRRRAG